jgi:hypothetical protein
MFLEEEGSEPKFKLGDVVKFLGDPRIKTLTPNQNYRVKEVSFTSQRVRYVSVKALDVL